jgi:hypothetical protein
MQDTTQLDQSSLNSLLNSANGGGASTSLIPESLTTALSVGFIVLNVISILFLILYIVSLVRKWKVQSAVLHMQKDLAEIKLALAPKSVQVEPVVVPPTTPERTEPAADSRTIASSDDTTDSTA